jgi:hypothetical protein
VSIRKWRTPWQQVSVYKVSSFRFHPCHVISCPYPRCRSQPPRLHQRPASQFAHCSKVSSMQPHPPFRVAITSRFPAPTHYPSNQALPYSPNSPVCYFSIHLTHDRRRPPPHNSPLFFSTHSFAFLHTSFPPSHHLSFTPAVVSPPPISRFSHPNPFVALESDDSDDNPSHPPLLCSITPSLILADSGATHVLLGSLYYLPSPISCTPPHFHPRPSPSQMDSFPLNSVATFTFPAFLSLFLFGLPLTQPYPTSLLVISPLLQASCSCLLTPTTLSIFAPEDLTPDLVGSKRDSENVWRLRIPPLLPLDPQIRLAPIPTLLTFSPLPHSSQLSPSTPPSLSSLTSKTLPLSPTSILNAIRRGYIKIRGLKQNLPSQTTPICLHCSRPP